jgi:branched-chain amino acid transport system permease protein
MDSNTFLISMLNGLSYGLLLFMLSSGLTLIFSMLGVLNFAHASFYMLGAYFAYQISTWLGKAVGAEAGFWIALVLAPLLVGVLGALVERHGLRKVHKFGHVPELLFTFGLSFIIVELVQVIWGRAAVPYRVPASLDGPVQWLQSFGLTFAAYRTFIMAVAVVMLGVLWWVLKKTRIGLVIQAALTHPETVEALGHNVPRIFMLVFGGGCALAGLAGVIGGPAFVTEPSMAATLGSIIFVVIVVGGMGSLAGAFIASLLIGLMTNFAIKAEMSVGDVLAFFGAAPNPAGSELLKLSISQIAPVLPYLLLVLILILRPRGLLGTREG